MAPQFIEFIYLFFDFVEKNFILSSTYNFFKDYYKEIESLPQALKF